MSVIERAEQFVGIDVVPVVFARPILTPPRSTDDLADPPLFAFRCPLTGNIELVDEDITLWPFTMQSAGKPVVLRRGLELFVGPHLLRPEKRERLLAVLSKVYEDDLKFGHGSRWVETRAVAAGYQPPAAKQFPNLFVSSTPKKPVARRTTTPAPTA